MDINALVESRLKAHQSEGDRLRSDWKELLGKVNESRAKKGEGALSEMDERNLAILFENASMDSMLRSKKSFLNEATDSSNIDFLGVQLPVIASIIPSLVLSEIATVQALDRRAGSVFYLNVKTATTKDGIASGSTLIDAKTGYRRGAASRTYGSQISTQNVGITGQASVAAYLTNRPVNAGTVQITDGVEIFTDNGSGVLVSNLSGAANGTVNYTNGAVNVTWTLGASAAQPVATYTYFYESATNPSTGVIVPEVSFDLVAETLTAIDFTLQTKFTAAAQLDAQKAHGLDLNSEVVKVLGGALKFEMDHFGIDKMYNASIDTVNGAGQTSAFTITPSSSQEFVWRKFQLNDVFEQASNLIFNKTLRGSGSFIVCGNNVARVVKQLKPDFTPVSGAKAQGPHKIGELNGRTVIQDPFLPTGTFFMGHKGDSYLDSSFIYAPYIPMFSTPTLTTADMVSQKGFMSSSAYKIVNAGLFSGGTLIG